MEGLDQEAEGAEPWIGARLGSSVQEGRSEVHYHMILSALEVEEAQRVSVQVADRLVVSEQMKEKQIGFPPRRSRLCSGIERGGYHALLVEVVVELVERQGTEEAQDDLQAAEVERDLGVRVVEIAL